MGHRQPLIQGGDPVAKDFAGGDLEKCPRRSWAMPLQL